MPKNDILFSKEITDMTNLGSGVTRGDDNRIVFVNNGVTGDICDIKIIKSLSGYDIGVVDKLLKPSAYRAENQCKCYRQCGGCVFRHIDYSLEKKIKENYVINAFKKYADIEIHPESISTSVTDYYRNNVRNPIGIENGRIFAGFYSERSHKVVEVEKCYAEKECISEIYSRAVELLNTVNLTVYDETTGCGYLRYICIRCNRSNEFSVCFTVNGNRVEKGIEEISDVLFAEFPKLTGVYVNFNRAKTNVIFGEKTITVCEKSILKETICGREFEISPRSFFQINTETAELLYYKAKEYLNAGENDVVVDLYCGTGTVGICTAGNASALYGCEIIPEAVENARKNAEKCGIKSYRFDVVDASVGIDNCIKTFGRIDKLTVDPPRKGLSEETINAITGHHIKQLVYISCNPDTLARDCGILAKYGYSVEKSALFDLFPRTSHVETVVLLSRK